MNQSAQQKDLFPKVAEQSFAWTQLVVPAEQISRLHSGNAEYIADFITPAEETHLLAAVHSEAWKNDLKRRVQHYGYRYDYTERNIKAGGRLGALPCWAKEISDRLVQKKIFPSPPDQLIVNEYQPDQGIAPHTDRDCFGPVVASLSLGSDCMMQILPHGNSREDAFDIVLLRRSLVVFQGKSREVWRHGIAPRKNDKQDGNQIPRQRRVSLTFRTVKTDPADLPDKTNRLHGRLD